MKHWDPSDSLADSARLSRADRNRLDAAIARSRQARSRQRPDLASVVGLTLSIAFLAGLAWAVTPTSPVSAEVR